MTNPTAKSIADTLAAIEAQERDPNHPRAIARSLVAKYRKGKAIDETYRFEDAPVELRRVIYDGTVRFSRRRWWARILR